MTKSDFELLGFSSEILPSGYLNIINTQPFCYNNTKTICCYGGRYVRTTTHKSIESVLSNLFQLETIDRSTLNPRSVNKTKTRKTQEETPDAIKPVTNQDLSAFLSEEFPAQPKKRRTRKSV